MGVSSARPGRLDQSTIIDVQAGTTADLGAAGVYGSVTFRPPLWPEGNVPERIAEP